MFVFFFFFNDTATTEIYTLSLHDALPISEAWPSHFKLSILPNRRATGRSAWELRPAGCIRTYRTLGPLHLRRSGSLRSEEHTSELQSRQYLVCRLLLEKKNTCS